MMRLLHSVRNDNTRDFIRMAMTREEEWTMRLLQDFVLRNDKLR